MSEGEQSTLKHLRGAIKTLPNLTYLKLSDITCSSEAMSKMIGNASNLNTIHLSNCNVSGLMEFLNTLIERVPNVRFDITPRFQPVVFGKALGSNMTLQTLVLETSTKRSAKFLASALKTNIDLRCLKLKGQFSNTCEILSVIANLQNTTLWRLEGVRIENEDDLDILTKFFTTNTSLISLSLYIADDMFKQQSRIEAAVRQNKCVVSLRIQYRSSMWKDDLRWLSVITDDVTLQNFELHSDITDIFSPISAENIETLVQKNKTLRSVSITRDDRYQVNLKQDKYDFIEGLLKYNPSLESLTFHKSEWKSSRNAHNTIQREVSLVDLLLDRY